MKSWLRTQPNLLRSSLTSKRRSTNYSNHPSKTISSSRRDVTQLSRTSWTLMLPHLASSLTSLIMNSDKVFKVPPTIKSTKDWQQSSSSSAAYTQETITLKVTSSTFRDASWRKQWSTLTLSSQCSQSWRWSSASMLSIRCPKCSKIWICQRICLMTSQKIKTIHNRLLSLVRCKFWLMAIGQSMNSHHVRFLNQWWKFSLNSRGTTTTNLATESSNGLISSAMSKSRFCLRRDSTR